MSAPPWMLPAKHIQQLKQHKPWRFGPFEEGELHFLWLQHMLFHLAPGGTIGVFLSTLSLGRDASPAAQAFKADMIQQDLLDGIIALPGHLVMGSARPGALWFISKGRSGPDGVGRDRQREVLMIDGRDWGQVQRRDQQLLRELAPYDISALAKPYQCWKAVSAGTYHVEGLTAVVPTDTIKKTAMSFAPWH